MNQILLNIIIIAALTITITSCSKKKSKKIESLLISYIQNSPSYLEISSEKKNLFQEAKTLKPEEEANLETLARTQIKISNVFAEKLPALIKQEREVTLGLIHSWGEKKVQNITREVETDTLQELLATAIQANRAACERFHNFGRLASELNQMGKQTQALIEEGNVEKLKEFQEKFNHLGDLFKEEQVWLRAHPPLDNKEAVITAFKKEHQASKYLEDAIHLYHLNYN